VNVTSQKLFSGSGLATNEDRDVALSRMLGELQRLTNLRIVADEIRLNADSVATVAVLAGQRRPAMRFFRAWMPSSSESKAGPLRLWGRVRIQKRSS
jgi:hypothetical protein